MLQHTGKSTAFLSKKQAGKDDALAYDAAARILELKKTDETYGAFAKRVGLSPQIVSNYKKKVHGASVNALADVVLRTEVNPRWLLTGDGPRYRTREGEPIPERLRVAGEVVEEMVQLVKRYEAATSTVADDPVQGKLRSRRRALRDVAQAEHQQAEPQSPPAKAPKRKRRSSSGGSDPE